MGRFSPPGPHAGGVDVYLITDSALATHEMAEIADLLRRTDGVLWVDIPAGDPDAAQVLSDVFHFHPLAVKDCLERNRVPKMHAYADCVFVVLHAPNAANVATCTSSNSTSSSGTIIWSPFTAPTTPPSPKRRRAAKQGPCSSVSRRAD